MSDRSDDKLRAQLREARNRRAEMQEGLAKARAERDAFRAENEQLRAALLFYARAWSTPQPKLPSPIRPQPTAELIVDAGEKARRALGGE